MLLDDGLCVEKGGSYFVTYLLALGFCVVDVLGSSSDRSDLMELDTQLAAVYFVNLFT